MGRVRHTQVPHDFRALRSYVLYETQAHAMSKEEIEMFDAIEYAKENRACELAYARREGREEGLTAGREEVSLRVVKRDSLRVVKKVQPRPNTRLPEKPLLQVCH